ncbi:hypothetical protein A2442_03615 [Candidatus Campbellbacteria bacterium RIFOXYC2_FULL_35_25]|uniref:Cell envelope integrity protein CreD n=1 Tax=Candidatus Campbellbacteria bacterium RIFOXYC2_FULL_35_25 TaxID=1797582 RepID=A0A1F5EJW1_9BACT|nr:MAG: hypothetical protein A2442_03615 [Candidatus Campbellbacteria bacterium RIFOXYC2_FULL_35_25]
MNKLQTTLQSTTLRVIFIAILALLLLIPVGMVKSVIYERQANRELAIQDITSKWGEEQVVAGPILTVPYDLYRIIDGKQIKEIAYAHFLPETLNIETTVSPELRSRGIYDAVVYSSNISVSGDFEKPDFAFLGINSQFVHWNGAFIAIGISDIRGLEERTDFKLNNQNVKFVSGIITDDVIRNISSFNQPTFSQYEEKVRAITVNGMEGGSASGLSVNVPANSLYSKSNFSFDLKLKGSGRLAFAPVGKTTDVKVSSEWVSPSFDGSFLPDNREVDNSGFTSDWHVLDLNRNYPQAWVGSNYGIYDSVFGVSLINPVDGYQKSDRSVKYALLIIALTFLIFLSFEMFNRKKIHPIQYILVGLALVLFYALLISTSEILGFNIAYGIAGTATIGLILLYSLTVLKEKKFVAIEGGVLIFLYAFIYILLQLEDYALLIGSVGLFLILATIMYLSRKVDWYLLDGRGEQDKIDL